MEYTDLDKQKIENKRVLVRVDLNVPVLNKKILDGTRIEKVIPTLKYLLARKAKIILVSHFGRPKNENSNEFSLEFLCKEIENLIPVKVLFSKEIIGEDSIKKSNNLKENEILLLENIRFHPGETKNDSEFASKLAKLADFYVNDAFSCSHRAHASISRIREFLPSSYGLLLKDEITNLSNYLSAPTKPIIAIIGGSKVSTKLSLLTALINKVDYLVIGGAMANTFFKAKNYNIGSSFYEPELIPEALEILNSNKIILPIDVVVAKKIAESESNYIVDINDFKGNEMILDIGPDSIKKITDLLKSSKTLIMNGPVGVFEYFPFSVGTSAIIEQAAKLTLEKKLISIAGGGDIVAAISKTRLFDQFTYISTAGGAFLEWLEGKQLPGL